MSALMAAPGRMLESKARWEHCAHEADVGVRGFGRSPAALSGPSNWAGVTLAIFSASRRAVALRTPDRTASLRKPRSGNAVKWARSAQAIIILKCRRLLRSSMRIIARAYGLRQDDVVITIHCGSRGLGHQIGTDFLREMVVTAKDNGSGLPDPAP